MFDIGFLELLLIGVVGLLVLGPERLPKAARTLGLWIGKIKRTVSGMQREISAQLEAEELRQKLNEQQKKLDESLNQARRGVEGVAEPTRPSDPPPRTPDTPAEGDAASSPGEGERREGSSPLERLDDALARKGGHASAAEEPPAAPQDSATSRAKDSSAP